MFPLKNLRAWGFSHQQLSWYLPCVQAFWKSPDENMQSGGRFVLFLFNALHKNVDDDPLMRNKHKAVNYSNVSLNID